MKRVVIFGGGDQARTAYVYLSEDSPHEVVAFTAHDARGDGQTLMGLQMVPFGTLEEYYPPDQYALFIAIGYRRVNRNRADVFDECSRRGYELISYVSSRASHCSDMVIGRNCFILENCAIQPFAKIGDNVVISAGSVIGHDAVIGDHCFIAPGVVITGGVTIGPYSFIGANATLRNGVRIGRECVIGAGALILKDTREREVYLVKGTEPSSISASALSLFVGNHERRRLARRTS